MQTPPEFAIVQTNGIRLRVALAGKGPLVVLVHGWPESWYSWRHQISALAEAGYRVAAPDVRGYGGSDKPAAIEAYSIKDMCTDIAGLIESLGEKQAVLVGHDWGAPIVWNTSLFFPERVRAVAGLSVPHAGRGPAPRIELFRNIYTRIASSIRSISSNRVLPRRNSGPTCAHRCGRSIMGPRAKASRRDQRPKKLPDAKYLDGLTDPDPLPHWLTRDDLDYYVGEFERSGFRGPLNRYRTSEIDFAQQAEVANRPDRAAGGLHGRQP